MMISAVWSSGNGSDTLPFHVASYADARLMRDDTGDSAVCCSLMGRPLRRKAVQPVQRLDGENYSLPDGDYTVLILEIVERNLPALLP